jgi:6-phosphogluconate dehydrogenase (decarboxylating)
MIHRFVDDRDLWVGAIEAVADLDALMSLAAHAINAGRWTKNTQIYEYMPMSLAAHAINAGRWTKKTQIYALMCLAALSISAGRWTKKTQIYAHELGSPCN